MHKVSPPSVSPQEDSSLQSRYRMICFRYTIQHAAQQVITRAYMEALQELDCKLIMTTAAWGLP